MSSAVVDSAMIYLSPVDLPAQAAVRSAQRTDPAVDAIDARKRTATFATFRENRRFVPWMC